MQATLFMVGFFPPPATGADVFAFFDGACAGGAADTRIVLFVERIDGDFVLCDVVFHLFERPVGDRVDLDEGRAVGIFTNFGDVGAGDDLVPANPGDPRVQIGQRPR